MLVDGAQWVAHHPDRCAASSMCDFYAFSGHKLFGPTGIGVLYGKSAICSKRMPPYQGGGDMIESVTFAKTIYAALPNKFEAGTPNIAGAVGLGAAIDYRRIHRLSPIIAATNTSCSHYATGQLVRDSRHCASSAPPRKRRASSPSCWRTRPCRPSMSACSSIATASPSAPAIIAANRSWVA